jgi:hypothetical protein
VFIGLILLMDFERLAKSHFGRHSAVAVAYALTMFFEKFRESGLRHAVMRCFERLPNFFPASKSSGIITKPDLWRRRFGFRVFCHVFVDLRGFMRLTVE